MRDSDFMDAAWHGFIRWASKSTDVLNEYKAETGRTYPPPAPANGLEAMIDEATGSPAEAAEHFMLWATRRLWGEDEAPESVREKLRETGSE